MRWIPITPTLEIFSSGGENFCKIYFWWRRGGGKTKGDFCFTVEKRQTTPDVPKAMGAGARFRQKFSTYWNSRVARLCAKWFVTRFNLRSFITIRLAGRHVNTLNHNQTILPGVRQRIKASSHVSLWCGIESRQEMETKPTARLLHCAAVLLASRQLIRIFEFSTKIFVCSYSSAQREELGGVGSVWQLAHGERAESTYFGFVQPSQGFKNISEVGSDPIKMLVY